MELNTIHDRNGASCQNCGWGSHCGTPRYAEVREKNFNKLKLRKRKNPHQRHIDEKKEADQTQ